MATSKIERSIKDIIVKTVNSGEVEVTGGTSLRCDIPIPTESGYKFLLSTNPAMIGETGPCWITINNSSTCRVWGTPALSGTVTFQINVLYIKG